MIPETVQESLTVIAFFLTIYIMSSVNFSILAANLLHKQDLRLTGSKNAGATNLLRVAGVKIAIAVLLLDVFRAYGLILLVHHILHETWLPIMAAALLVGNIFPLFHRFKGGKGMAAAAGALLAINPLIFAAGFITFAVIVAIFRRVSASSLAMLLTIFVLLILINSTTPIIITSGIIFLIVILTHKNNILRLLKGKEPPIWK